MRSPLLAVTGLAIHIGIGTVTRNDRIQSLRAVFALEALAVPFAAFSQDLFSGKYHSSASWATFAGRGLDGGGVNKRCLRRLLAVGNI